MPSATVSPRVRALALVGFGVALVVVAVFAPMGGSVTTYRYGVEEVAPDSAVTGYVATHSDRVLTCVEASPSSEAVASPAAPCRFVSRVRENGSVVVEDVGNAVTPGFGDVYEVVYYPAEAEFYAPRTENLDDGSWRLRLDPISNRTVLHEHAAYVEQSAPPEIRRLFENGTVRTSHPILGWALLDDPSHPTVFEYDGSYYRPTMHGQFREEYDGPPPELIRAAAALGGVGLLLYGRTRHLDAKRR